MLTFPGVTHMAVFQRRRVLCDLPFLEILRILPGTGALDNRDDVPLQVGALQTAWRIPVI